MFYNEPEKLVSESDINLVKTTLNEFIGLKRVSPLLISKKLPQIPEEDILSIIFQLSIEKYIEINYEITCPECSSDIMTLSSLKDIPEEIVCEICDHDNEFMPTYSDIWITLTVKKVFPVQGQIKKFENKENVSKLNLNDVSNNMGFLSLTDEEFFEIDINKFKSFLIDVVDAKTNDEKKNSMENMGEYLFSCIANFEIVERNKRTPTSELDIITENNNPFQPFLRDLGLLIPIECKNWKDPVGASEIRDFGGDMAHRKFQTGVLISKAGITGKRDFRTDAQGEVVSFFQRGNRILVLNLEDLNQISEGNNLIKILREKNRGLHLS